MIKDGKEFTGLQGLVGARYAEDAGESETVSRALAEQYLPRGAGDPLPRTPVGIVLAFADRLDTLAGCWAAGFVPSGSQDPYGLRRAANGMIRILLEGEHPVSLRELVGEAVAALPASGRSEGLEGELLGFLRDRIAFFLREEGIGHDVVESVLASDADDPVDARARARALSGIREDKDLERLVVGFKRAANILKGIDPATLPDLSGEDGSGWEAAERDLHRRAGEVRGRSETIRAGKDYPALLTLLLGLRAPIDRFFDDVLVMSENETEKRRRLAVLAEVRDLFHHAFDPSLIVLPGES
jgi:glycyl-tRNA synthetase beta chain